MLLVVKRTSNQARTGRGQAEIHACLFEIRLFNDDLPAILRAQVELLRHNGCYLAPLLPPLLWMIVPLVLVIAQLQAAYGWRAPRPGEEVLVRRELAEGAGPVSPGGSARPPARARATRGPRPRLPRVWTPALGEMAWRISADRPGSYQLTVSVAGLPFTKSLVVGDGAVRLSPAPFAEPARPADLGRRAAVARGRSALRRRGRLPAARDEPPPPPPPFRVRLDGRLLRPLDAPRLRAEEAVRGDAVGRSEPRAPPPTPERKGAKGRKDAENRVHERSSRLRGPWRLCVPLGGGYAQMIRPISYLAARSGWKGMTRMPRPRFPAAAHTQEPRNW